MRDILIQDSLKTVVGKNPTKTGTVSEEGESFGAVLKDSIEKVNKLQNEADQAITELAVGKTKSIHKTMIALEKADMSFQMMMQVRNKIVEAYEEIMRMQV
ncbi:MAG: flagellar hook-basal body complex protein FliE [Pseudomonadota bacterium]